MIKNTREGQMRIILIGYKARQGKDTFASMLWHEFDRLGNRASIFHFASPMKEILSETMGVSRETLDAMKNENAHYRGMLQRFGSGKMKEYFGVTVWRDLAVSHMEELEKMGVEYVIVPDFRFPAEFIDGALTIKVVRPGVCIGDGHISETAMDVYDFDMTVVNDLDLDYLEKEAERIAGMLQWGEL